MNQDKHENCENESNDFISLNSAIHDILDKGQASIATDVRNAYRKIDKLLEKLGINKNDLKEDGRHIKISRKDLPYLTILLRQAIDGKGIVGKIISKTQGPDQVTYKDFSDLMDSLRMEGKQQGFTEAQLDELWFFYDKLLSYSARKRLTECHTLIDLIARYSDDLSPDGKAHILDGVIWLLKAELFIRITEVPINVICLIKLTKNLQKLKLFPPSDDEIEEISSAIRDKLQNLKELLREDADLHNYVCKKIGEDIDPFLNAIKTVGEKFV